MGTEEGQNISEPSYEHHSQEQQGLRLWWAGFLSFTEDRKTQAEEMCELPQRHFFIWGWGRDGIVDVLPMLKYLKSFNHTFSSLNSTYSGTQKFSTSLKKRFTEAMPTLVMAYALVLVLSHT